MQTVKGKHNGLTIYAMMHDKIEEIAVAIKFGLRLIPIIWYIWPNTKIVNTIPIEQKKPTRASITKIGDISSLTRKAVK